MTIKNRKDLSVNVSGIALSLFLSFAVWGAVVLLIGNNERELLGNKSISDNIILITNEAARTEPYITAEIFEISALPNHMIRNLLKYLADGEMTEWKSAGAQFGRVLAEEKIGDFIEFLTECGFLKSGGFVYDMALYGPIEGEEVNEMRQFVFWKGVASNSDYTVTYVINAESGGIWYAEIASNAEAFEFGGLLPEHLLSAYETFLGYPTVRPIYYSEKSAYRVYGSSFVINAEIDGNKLIMRLLPY